MSTAVLASWLLTYLVHSTVLLGAAWLISRALGDRHLALQEILLRIALVGGVVTATVQVGLGVEPVGGAVGIGATPATEMTATAADGAAGSALDVYVADSHVQRGFSWPALLLTLWCVGSLAMVLTLGRSMIDLGRAVVGYEQTDDAVAAIFDDGSREEADLLVGADDHSGGGSQ